MAKLIICGDFAPTKSNEEILSSESPQKIIGDELCSEFNQCDCAIVNLETSLVRDVTPKTKRGQINYTKPEVVNFLSRANIKLCCLANNHIIDNGNDGLISSIKYLEEKSIYHIGAGKNIDEASRPYILNRNKKSVRILNIANYEFNRITAKDYGVNIYDPLETFDYIRMQALAGDYVIVIFHSGVEYYQYPTPELQRICRKMVDCGANLVTCQHSHCIGTYEKYKNSMIFYGQGNFLFDDGDKILEKNAIILKVDTEKNDIKIMPVIKQDSLVRTANNKEKQAIIHEIEVRNNEIKDESFVKQQFKLFCESEKTGVLSAMVGNNLFYRIINKITKRKFEDYFYNSRNKMRIYNIISSPSLLEVIQEVMRGYEE